MKTLHHGIIVAIARAAHAERAAGLLQQLAGRIHWCIGCPDRYGAAVLGGRRLPSAICQALSTRSASIRSAIAQPTTRRENKSRRVARYNQPSARVNVGDIPHPFLVRPRRLKVLVEQVGSGTRARALLRGARMPFGRGPGSAGRFSSIVQSGAANNVSLAQPVVAHAHTAVRAPAM